MNIVKEKNNYERKIGKSGHSGMTTIPTEIMSMLDLKIGDKIEFVERDGKIELRKAEKSRSEDIINMAKGIMEEDRDILIALRDN